MQNAYSDKSSINASSLIANSKGNADVKSMPAVPFLQRKASALSPGPVIQRLKWKRVDGKYKVYDPDTNAVRAPGDEEEIVNNPSVGVWRSDSVWDDDNEKWLQPGEGGLVDMVEALSVTPITIATYNEGPGKNFGHRFSFIVHMNARSVKWYEKTEKPYVGDMPENEYFDMYEKFKGSSDVFIHARTLKDTYWGYSFSDPPGILLEPNNKRKLEFNIQFEDKTGAIKTITGVQELETDGEGVITKQILNLNWS